MGRRRLDSDRRREQILDAAMAVFADKGFVAASMDDIVSAAGLSKGGVYWHFKSKDDIIASLFDRFFAGQLAQLAAQVDHTAAVRQQLRRLAEQTAAALDSLAHQFPSPLEFYTLAVREAPLMELLGRYLLAYHAILQDLVRRGVSTGEFRPVDPAQTATTLVSLFEGLLLVWAVYPLEMDLGAQLTAAIDLLLEGLLATPITVN